MPSPKHHGHYPWVVIAAWLSIGLLATLSPAQTDIGSSKPYLHGGRGPGATGRNDTPRSATRIVADFRRARSDPQQRAALVDEAITSGEEATERLLAMIEKELRPQLDSYRARFVQEAAKHARRQVGEVDLQEVGRLRQKVLALKEREDLSKEMIVTEADPAMRRLQEIFVVDRQAVLDASESLGQVRDRLAELGQLWEKCVVHLYDNMPAGEQKPQRPPSFEQYLVGEEQIAAGLATPMAPSTRVVLAANARLAQRLDSEEARAILAVNLTRNLLGLNPLATDLRLCAAARDHSADMERLKFFSHTSPVPGKSTPWDRAKLFGTTASGENIAMGYRDGKAASDGWFHSPGHHKNMLGNHRRVGVGRKGTHYTQLFGR